MEQNEIFIHCVNCNRQIKRSVMLILYWRNFITRILSNDTNSYTCHHLLYHKFIRVIRVFKFVSLPLSLYA